MFVAFSVNFDDFAWGFFAAGEEAAADDGVGEGEGFNDVAAFGDAAIGDEANVIFGGCF